MPLKILTTLLKEGFGWQEVQRKLEDGLGLMLVAILFSTTNTLAP